MSARWHEPVRIVLHGVTHLIFDNTRAAEVLLMEWPGPQRHHYQMAQQALVAAMRQEGDSDLGERARRAFATAASEAGLLCEGRTGAVVSYGYSLISPEGSETFTTNRALADRLASQGWMLVGYLALPIAATEAMTSAAESALAEVLSGCDYVLPQGGMKRVLSAALASLNGPRS